MGPRNTTVVKIKELVYVKSRRGEIESDSMLK